MKVDLTVTISVILGCAAVVSPILTALINNHHQRKMKLLELKQEKYKETVVYRRNLIEAYLQKTAKCISYHRELQQNEYEESFGKVISYVPDNIRDKMIRIDGFIHDLDNAAAYKDFIQLLPELTAIVQKL